MRRTIVLFHTGHANDLESLQYQRRTFANFGYTIEDYSVVDPQIHNKLSSLLQRRSTEISFFLSSNYYATSIRDDDRQLLHTATGIPLVIMQHDHPLHYLHCQAPELKGTITFAIGDESVEFINAYYPVPTSLVSRSGARPLAGHMKPEYDTFLEKTNTILCPMNLAVNGLGLDETWQRIKQLPKPRRERAVHLAEMAIDDCFMPLHSVARSLLSDDATTDNTCVLDQLLVLNFIKVWRRNHIVRALIELPIIVSSEYVPADLEFKYGAKFTLLSRTQTMHLYAKYRFILNCNPVMTNVLHERVLEAVYNNSVAITEPNCSIIEYLRDEYDCIFFNYDGTDISTKLTSYLENPANAYALTEHAYKTRKASRDFGLDESYGKLLKVVDAWWAQHSRPFTDLTFQQKETQTRALNFE